MEKLDYTKLEEITVKSQEELDAIPADFQGRIYIEFGTCYNRAVVNKSYPRRVVARENSSVVARENSSVEAWGNSSVVAWENSSVEARENSSVEARENSSVVARENSSVVARENSFVVARENSFVEAWGNSSVEAWENSSVVAWENSSVVATGNTQIVDRLWNGKIQISGNARIVYMPKDIHSYMDFYGIKHTKTKATFYKAVHKSDGAYFSEYDYSFKYEIGSTVVPKEEVNADTSCECGSGIHIAHLNWALDFGREFKGFAILEVETKISDIVYPTDNDGKLRTAKAKVLREVPLEECGAYGKILARRAK